MQTLPLFAGIFARVIPSLIYPLSLAQWASFWHNPANGSLHQFSRNENEEWNKSVKYLCILLKEELHNRFNLISEESVTISKHNSEKPDQNRLKNKEVMTLWIFKNFQETFLDQSIWICKWVRWWCHRLTTFHSFCTQKWQKIHISAMRMLDLP